MLAYTFKAQRPVTTEAVDFGILSPDEIRRMAVCEIKNPLVYCRGMPMPEGVIDARMGVCDRRLRCATCNQSVQHCPGHCGFIDLGVPMFVAYTDTCLKCVRSVCYCCSALLGGEEEAAAAARAQLPKKQWFHSVYSAARTKKVCGACGAPQPTYSRSATLGLKIDWAEDLEWESDAEKELVTSRLFTSVEVHSILANMSDDHVRALGFDPAHNHPKFLVPDVLLVPPSSARPAIMQSSGSRLRGQDDVTLKLNDINKRAADLRALMESLGWAPTDPMVPEIADKMVKLQAEIYALIHAPPVAARGASGPQHGSSAPIKTLTSRLKGKEGRIRGNLMGKRVDHSARSVITPDSLMGVDQIGVPHCLAKTLTLPETVCPYNIKRLRARVLAGTDDVAGAQSVTTKDGGVVQLQFLDADARAEIRLQFGDVVERHVQDDDWVIFNRQPSLHRQGFMGHRVRLYEKGQTFRLNLSVTAPYNADFDGDEMNLHVCQGVQARTEVEHLMSVSRQVITPQSARPTMGIVQDSLIGAHLLTSKSCLLTRSEVMQLVVWISRPAKNVTTLPPPAIRRPGPYWTGAQVFSMLLPRALRIDRLKFGSDHPLPEGVLVRDGALLHGQLTKSMLGTSGGSIVDVMYREVGAAATIAYMSNEQRLIVPFLMLRGFSVSFRDAAVSAEGRAKVREHVAKVKENVQAIVDADLPADLAGMAEGTVFSLLSKLLLTAGAVGKKYMRKNSAILQLVESGSKGNQLNVSQIVAVVGQQSVEGKRIHSEATTRTLTCFDKHDRSLLGHGFVESSYGRGLSPAEFFFHNVGGREGLVDTAVKTAHTGYIQRRMVKSLEDLHSTYEGSIRNAQGQVVQFSYGLDGWDTCKVRHAQVRALSMGRAEIERVMLDGGGGSEVQRRELARVLECTRRARAHRVSVMRPAMTAQALLPFGVDDLLRRFGAARWTPADEAARAAHEARVEACVEELCSTLASDHAAHGRDTCILAIRFGLCSRALRRAGCGPDAVPALFAYVRAACLESLVTPGEAVGSIAAQSLGEPTTQLTLNTFHQAGVGNKSVTMGVPRLKELLDASQHPRTPMTTLWLKAPYCYDAAFVAKFARTLPVLKLKDLVKETTIELEPEGAAAATDADRTIVEIDAFFREPDPEASRFVARLALRKDSMRERDLTPPYLHHLIEQRYGVNVHIVSSEVNSLDWVLRLRYRDVAKMIRVVDGGAGASTADLESTLVMRITNLLLEQIVVGGHVGVAQAHEREVEVWNEAREANETVHVVDAMGNILNSAALFPVVDAHRSYTNDPHEALACLGIEAAMATIHHEADAVISYDSTKVDKRHIAMIADAMTSRGKIVPMSRHGLNRAENGAGVLVRASFEETIDTLLEAGVYGESDPAQGVTFSVMAGEESSIIGTGCFEVLVPRDSLPGAASGTAPRKRAVKSSLRGSSSAPPAHSVGYVDKSLWSFSADAPTDSVSRPFLDTTDEAPGAPMPVDGASYDTMGTPPAVRKKTYIPSSPRVV